MLRGAQGGDVEVADGAGWWAPAVLEPPGTVRLTAAAVRSPVPSPRLHLVQGLAKGRKLDEVVRTATELGVDAVTPVVCARAVVRIDGDRGARAVRRWRAVARAASEQSRRPWRPTIGEVVRVAAPLPAPLAMDAGDEPMSAGAAVRRLVLVMHPGARPLPDVLAEATRATGAIGVDELDEVVLAIGPEGGWTDGEVAMLEAAGALTVGLGPTVLRTEHAGAAGLAVVAAGLGRWSAAATPPTTADPG